jgi:hypothetical protein
VLILQGIPVILVPLKDSSGGAHEIFGLSLW